MKAIILKAFGEVSVFRETVVSVPEIEDNEVLIKVHARRCCPSGHL